MNRQPVRKCSMNTAFDMVRSNMARAIEKHGNGAYVGAHEALGILTEEYDELIGAVRSDDPVQVEKELMDVAQVAIFGIASGIEQSEHRTKGIARGLKAQETFDLIADVLARSYASDLLSEISRAIGDGGVGLKAKLASIAAEYGLDSSALEGMHP